MYVYCRELVVSAFYVKPCMFICRERVVSAFYVKPFMFIVENLF